MVENENGTPEGGQQEAGSQRFINRINTFAEAVEADPGKIIEALTPHVGEPSEKALTILDDESSSSIEDLTRLLCFGGPQIPVGVLKHNLQILRGNPGSLMSAYGNSALTVLPQVPEEETFIASLKTGGVLKIAETEIISGVKCALAFKFKLFDIPEKLRDSIENFALQNDDPCPEAFYVVNGFIHRRTYADVLKAMGVEGSLMSTKRKKEFLQRLNDSLWSALREFDAALIGWQSSWMSGVTNQTNFIAAMVLKDRGAALPFGLMQAPPADAVIDAAEAVNDAINRSFAGTGIPVAKALANEAVEIGQMMANIANLPALVGAANQEQMLKILGVNVRANDIRLARNIAQYTLAVMQIKSKEAEGIESLIDFLTQLVYLSQQINWDTLNR